jgi:hypothetical protein
MAGIDGEHYIIDKRRTNLKLQYIQVSGIPFLKFKEISARNWKKTRETKAIWLPSKSDRVLVCTSQAEMLDKFEEYKIKTSSGWRCIKSNALFGK